jgi:hypothetical protein
MKEKVLTLNVIHKQILNVSHWERMLLQDTKCSKLEFVVSDCDTEGIYTKKK